MTTDTPALPPRPIFDDQWGETFQQTMRNYIERLELSVDHEGVDPTTISGGWFCGCSDCYERETYLMAVALTITGYREGKVKLEDELDQPVG